jgi:hypothetical protein
VLRLDLSAVDYAILVVYSPSRVVKRCGALSPFSIAPRR